MANSAVLELLSQAERSGLFSTPDSREFAAQLTSDDAITTEVFAARLVERRYLTPFQAELLLAGRVQDCRIAGRYLILAKLGEGGMGAVYRVHDNQLDRDVAVKVLPPRSLNDDDAVARFRREARALAKLSHPNIIQAYDSGVDNGRHFLVMEYVSGVNLADFLREHGAVPPTLAADMIYQAALGLHHAHEKGLVHRDLKPANLILASDQGFANLPSLATVDRLQPTRIGAYSPKPWKGIVKILDLGLARFLMDQIGDSQVTKEGTGVGTPDYMAPEQFRDALRADARTDVYGLGCTLYHLIAGTVPFPGSSLSEKADAHAKREPIPLEERSPEVPTGLALVASKMMAKHPSERFQTAGEAADALAPYVAGSSQSGIILRQSMRFDANRLTTKESAGKLGVAAWIGATVASVCLVGLLIANWSRFFPPSGNAGGTGSNGKPAAQVVIIPNGFTVAKDGSGQFTTISEALAKVDKPGMTIQVLDDATYKESVEIADYARLAGLTVMSPQRATVAPPPPTQSAFLIRGVPRVKISGFRLSIERQTNHCIAVIGLCPGVVLEHLECVCDSVAAAPSYGITLDAISLAHDDSPLVVRDCNVSGVTYGIQVLGMNVNAKTTTPSRRIHLHGNDVSRIATGIVVSGLVSDLQITANRVWNFNEAGVYFLDLAAASRGLLIVNNTFKGAHRCIGIQRPAAGLQEMELRNNLLLADRAPDFTLFADGGKDLLAGWRIDGNWRPTPPPSSGDADGKEWVPTSKDRTEPAPLASTEPTSNDYLRPAKGSPLATDGAGKEDAFLPTYFGAVPPEGTPAWDWSKTWNRKNRFLLKVSKDAKDGAEFRTINEALEKIDKPGMTIRVLDDATYDEAILLNNRILHTGLVLDSPRKATIAPPRDGIAVVVRSIPQVAVRGFRIRVQGERSFGVGVGGTCPGVVLEDLDIASTGSVLAGVHIENVALSDGDEPLRVRRCRFHSFLGVMVVGVEKETKRPLPCRRILIHDNEFFDMNAAIIAVGQINNVLISGNRLWNCSDGGLVLTDLIPGASGVLVANNTFNIEKQCIVVVQPPEGVADVAFRNNLVIAEHSPDIAYVGSDQSAIASWRIEHNWRSIKSPAKEDATAKNWVSAAKDRVGPVNLPLLNPASPDFLRPPKNSPLATEGAGKNDTTLPSYFGAVPPDGTPAWDWNITWKAWDKRPRGAAKRPAKSDDK